MVGVQWNVHYYNSVLFAALILVMSLKVDSLYSQKKFLYR